jgi:hypothetical protein
MSPLRIVLIGRRPSAVLISVPALKLLTQGRSGGFLAGGGSLGCGALSGRQVVQRSRSRR